MFSIGLSYRFFAIEQSKTIYPTFIGSLFSEFFELIILKKIRPEKFEMSTFSLFGGKLSDHLSHLTDSLWQASVKCLYSQNKLKATRSSTYVLDSGHDNNLMESLGKTAGALIKRGWLSYNKLLESQEPELLQTLGLINTLDIWTWKAHKYLNLHVSSHKTYDLINEVPEGYTSLIELLYSASKLVDSDINRIHFMDKLCMNMGQFNLDPHRVINIIIEQLEVLNSQRIGLGATEWIPKFKIIYYSLNYFNLQNLSRIFGSKIEVIDSKFLKKPMNGLCKAALILLEGRLTTISDLFSHYDAKKDALKRIYTVIIRKSYSKIETYKFLNQNLLDIHYDTNSVEISLASQNFLFVFNNNLSVLFEFYLIAILFESNDMELSMKFYRYFKSLGLDILLFKVPLLAQCRFLQRQLHPTHRALVTKHILYSIFKLFTPKFILANSIIRSFETIGPYILSLPSLFLMALRILQENALIYLNISTFDCQRVLKSVMSNYESEIRLMCYHQTINFFLLSLLPGKMISNGNKKVSFELWIALSKLHYPRRFLLFSEIPSLYNGHASLRIAKSRADKLCRTIFKLVVIPETNKDRLSDFLPKIRALAKIALSNPIPTINVMIDNVETYGNQAQLFSNILITLGSSIKNLTIYIILKHLGVTKSKKNIIFEDSLNIKPRVYNLNNFVSLIMKRINGFHKIAKIEIKPILYFILKIIKSRTDIIHSLIECILSKITNHFIFLQKEMGHQQSETHAQYVSFRKKNLTKTIKTMRFARENEKAIETLMMFFKEGTKNDIFSIPLLLLVNKHKILYSHSKKSIKILSCMFDNTHLVLLQALEIIFLNIGRKWKLHFAITSFLNLIDNFGIPIEDAFHIHRPILHDIELKFHFKKSVKLFENGKNYEKKSEHLSLKPNNLNKIKQLNQYRLFHCSLENLVADYNTWKTINKEFYAIFWNLSLKDIYIPKQHHKIISGKPADLIKKNQKSISSSQIEYTSQSFNNLQIKREVIERKKLIRGAQKLMNRLSQNWFHGRIMEYTYDALNGPQLYITIVREMLSHRCIFSPQDALFCAKFFEVVGYIKTPGFHILLYHSKFGVVRILRIVALITEIEAKNLGIFFHEAMTNITRWKRSKKDFDKSYYSKKILPKENLDLKSEASFDIIKDDSKTSTNYLSYDEFCNHYKKQYSSGLMDFALSSLSSSDNHLNVNAINILFSLCDLWPDSKHKSLELINLAQTLMKREELRRPDLALRARRYKIEIENFVIKLLKK